MKYGVLEYKNPNVVNIGDAMQILAVENLYRQIGIDDFIRVSYSDLSTYDGEEVLLPICFPFYGYNDQNRVTCFSDKIIPIFLSLSLYDTNLEEDEVVYLKRFEPIGCRDEHTARGLAEKGIQTYLNGCITLTLDVSAIRERKSVYCIDVPDEFYSYIPNELAKDVVKKTHIFKSVSYDTDEFALISLKEYASKAKLVITSRMHAAIPCLAVGIPVIFINKEYSYRFAWLEDIIPVYLREEWGAINWEGTCLYKSRKALEIRKLMTEIARDRIIRLMVNRKKIEKLQEIYAARDKRGYSRGPIDVAIKYVNENWERNTPREYGIWGVGQVAAALIDFLAKEYPLARLVTVIDAKKKRIFKGCIPQSVETVQNINSLFIFITADAVNPFALDYFDQIYKNKNSYLLCWQHITMLGKDIPSV